jgi:hypothetical protein
MHLNGVNHSDETFRLAETDGRIFLVARRR